MHRRVAGTKKACVANDALRPDINIAGRRSQTWYLQPNRSKARTMQMVAAVVKIYLEEGELALVDSRR